MSEHYHADARWFTKPVARRTILKAAAALTAMTSVPQLLSSPHTSAQDSFQEPPVIHGGYFSESLSGEGFSLASEEPHVFRAEFPFSAIGAHWASDAPENSFAVIELSYDGASWTDPIEMHESHDGHEDDIDGRHFSHLMPSDGHQFVRYRTYSPSGGFYELPDLVFTYIDAFDGPSPSDDEIDLAATKPPIISRNAWGADEKLRYEKQDTKNKVINVPRYETWRHAVIHHSVTTNGYDPYAMMRSIYYYHAITRGWGDIGYNFLVDHRGNVFEGRFGGENVVGTHSGVFNNGSAGICCLGTFENVDISASAQSALISIVSWVIRNYNPHEEKYLQGNLLPTIFGHRNISQTTCPGNALYNDLPYIRNAVANVLGTGQYTGGSGDLRSGQSVRIVTSGANVRSGPGTNFSVVRTLASGVSGTIDGGPVAAHGYTWYVVRTSAGSGWMATINFSTTAKPAGAFRAGDSVQTTGTLTLRASAGTNKAVLASMPGGTALRVTYAYNQANGYEWYKVDGSYGPGWVAGSFLSKVTPKGKFSKGARVVVNTDTLTLRASAGTNKAVRATMPRGTALTITYAHNRADGYEWYQVTGAYGTGWAAGEFLSSSSATSNPSPSPKPAGKFSKGARVAVNTDSLTLRAAAGTNKAVRASMPRGTALTVTYAYNKANGYEWYQVTGAYGTGWVAGDFLSASGGTGGSSSSGPKQIKVDFTVFTNDTQVNMRTQPSLSGTVRHRVAKGSKFQVIEGPRSANGYTWWRVRNSKYGAGWIVSAYLERR